MPFGATIASDTDGSFPNNHLRAAQAPRRAVTRKPPKTREELAAIVLARMNDFPGCYAVSGTVIAPVLTPKPGFANWHMAFTARGTESVPHPAWEIGSHVADEFDLA
jgi:hypothetical protein